MRNRLWILCITTIVILYISGQAFSAEQTGMRVMPEPLPDSILIQEIHTYDTGYYAGGWTAIDGMYGAMIDLKDATGKIIASAKFHRVSSTIPAADSSTNGYIILNYTIQAYPQIIDMLRSEKPVYLYFDKIRKIGGIVCRQLPVGEQETQ
jgi:hypothetical protein